MSNLIHVSFLKFGVVGSIGMLIDFTTTWLFKEKWHFNKYIANSIGFCCAVINNFLLNRFWTFEGNGHPFAGQFVKFALVSIAGLLINNLLLYILTRKVKLNFYIIKLSVTGIVFFWNYVINFTFTFK